MSPPPNDYVDCTAELAQHRWSSLVAPLLPTLLLSRDAPSSLFATPWHSPSGPVARLRAVVVRSGAARTARWALLLLRCAAVGSLGARPSAALVCFYAAALCLASLGASGAVAVSATTASTLVLRAGADRGGVACVSNGLCLARHGPRRAATLFLRQKLWEVAFTATASLVLPRDILTLHLTCCFLAGLAARAAHAAAPLLRSAPAAAAATATDDEEEDELRARASGLRLDLP
jgi:hypothetical protein